MRLERQRRQIVRYGKKLVAAQLTTGTGGNLSIRHRSRQIVISPSGIDYQRLTAADVVVVDHQGVIIDGRRKPSSELGFHLALYRQRSDIAAVVHTHSVYATALACLHWEIPAVHYLVGYAGKKVPLAEYATFGSQRLAKNICTNIGDHNAVLLANHGLVAVGPDLPSAFNVAMEIEFVAQIYYLTRCAGTPQLLSDAEMKTVLAKFKTYGQKSS